jgi:hypothetical protein
MHYPQCNGTQTGNLRLTDKDKQGAALLYPGASVTNKASAGSPDEQVLQ